MQDLSLADLPSAMTHLPPHHASSMPTLLPRTHEHCSCLQTSAPAGPLGRAGHSTWYLAHVYTSLRACLKCHSIVTLSSTVPPKPDPPDLWGPLFPFLSLISILGFIEFYEQLPVYRLLLPLCSARAGTWVGRQADNQIHKIISKCYKGSTQGAD